MTTEMFWNYLGAFNSATWMVQMIWLIAAIAITFFLMSRRSIVANILMKVLLSFTFAWNGIAFFLVVMDGPVYDYFFAPLFLIVAALFLIDIFTKQTEFRMPEKNWIKAVTYFWLLLWLIYPFIGLVLGRSFPQVCTPMNPCPSTVFAIAMIAAALPKVDKKVYIMLLPWALMGLPKCLGVFQCFEDCILFASGVYGLVILIVNWKRINQKISG